MEDMPMIDVAARFSSGDSAENRTVATAPPGRWLVAITFTAIMALRVLAILHYRIDSDEPQHLHVVWGWTHGLVQYRDVFDNHTPLFHLACIPIFKLVGERADAIVYMRFAMLPLFFFSLWCIHRLGTLIQSPATALWGAIFAALTPAFCFTSTEYRADDLWTALWLGSLVVLLGGEPGWKRGLSAGILFGATAATSLKTLALLGCLGLACFVGLFLTGSIKAAATDRKSRALLAAIIAGFTVVPALLALWFARQGALPDAIYGIFTYNSVPGLGRIRILRDFVIGLLELIGLIALLIPSSAWMARRLIPPQRRLRFHLIFLSSGFYGALIYTLWPLLDAEHLIPFQPLFVLGFMPLILDVIFRGVGSGSAKFRVAIPAAIAIAIVAGEAMALQTDSVRPSLQTYADLLHLSEPSDYVMDLKGETIFRRRPYRFLFEGVGIIRARKGLLPDDIPEEMIRTKTCIAIHYNYRFIFPRALEFLDANYIPVSSFRVLGHSMILSADQGTYTFNVVIPETYAFISDGRLVAGTIDGQPCAGHAILAKGPHEFLPNRPRQHMEFIWKQAIDRGFFPDYRAMQAAPHAAGKVRKHSA
jgi:hypothetical protein